METPDPHLPDLLKEWKIEKKLPHGFQSAVWRRIQEVQARSEETPWDSLLGFLERHLVKPYLAWSFVALLLFSGSLAGHWRTNLERDRKNQTLAQSYLRAVDPYKKVQE